MLSRCYKPGNRQYKDYGGRGISVHPDWHDFEKFSAAVGPHPGKGLTFDRADNEGDYEPGNTRWTTWKVQARNKRVNQLVPCGGKTMCVQDWADELGVTANHLYRRTRNGMTWVQAIQDVIDNPPKVRGPYKISNNNNNRKL